MQSKPKTIKGKYNAAVIFSNEIDQTALGQIKALCDNKIFKDSKIRIMPDVHAGVGCTIGTTMTIKDKVIPSMVGVDIGCGMLTVKLGEKEINYAELDSFIHKNIPAGKTLREVPHSFAKDVDLSDLKAAKRLRLIMAEKSVGTLGGGNHFIEIDDDGESLYLVVHTGSRHLGVDVAEFYQKAAHDKLCGRDRKSVDALIDRMKEQGRSDEIEATIKALSKVNAVPYELAYLEEELFEDYIHDMRITQRFASLNRHAIAEDIIKALGLSVEEEFETVHNYIDIDNMILRKGSVSAQKGEKLIIPLNMRDGSLICVGKGNEDWNCSAPHGAGRKMSRGKARSTLQLEEYKKQMQGIYTTSICYGTLDESPMAYKDMYSILNNIRSTVSVSKRILPKYNFKAAD